MFLTDSRCPLTVTHPREDSPRIRQNWKSLPIWMAWVMVICKDMIYSTITVAIPVYVYNLFPDGACSLTWSIVPRTPGNPYFVQNACFLLSWLSGVTGIWMYSTACLTRPDVTIGQFIADCEMPPLELRPQGIRGRLRVKTTIHFIGSAIRRLTVFLGLKNVKIWNHPLEWKTLIHLAVAFPSTLPRRKTLLRSAHVAYTFTSYTCASTGK